ncbi:MAG: alpha-D-ribose 1-methylphosphonate 5-phosphate C-P-lyase PhnJ [Clostridiales Family XIII bacterium]|jgi:alpha-D-ribose 1-methylphosphonate 5-phosphate C-P lyase|nr:alpha-D-ribose 1-methylphosphonate 5-phosphate C-P-lyase PhnJ [Clostridiales Family XIII bacterium]
MNRNYNFAYLDESSKREIRRAILNAIAIPGFQVPFGSRELPIGRGWGTGGIQITLSIILPDDTLKVIDQGSDDSVNAVSIKRFISECTGVGMTTDSETASVIQSRHRIPEIPLRSDQILVLQVPEPEPLKLVEGSEVEARRMHAEKDYNLMWLRLFEDLVQFDEIVAAAGYPVMVNGRYLTNPSPIPRYDVPKLNMSETLCLFGAGREKKIYAIPPYTRVEALSFEDVPFAVESFGDHYCCKCGAKGVFLDESYNEKTGEKYYQCSDTGYCNGRRAAGNRADIVCK